MLVCRLPLADGCAFVESERVNRERKVAEKAAAEKAEENSLGDEGIKTTHYWTYSPGDGAARWDDFYARGVMGVGWSKLGDVEKYASKEDIRKNLRTLYSSKYSQKNSALALWQFSREIKPGDVVFAKRGRSVIIGRGIVEGDYQSTKMATPIRTPAGYAGRTEESGTRKTSSP